MPPAKPKIKLVCEECGSQFEKLPSQVKKAGPKFCCPACHYSWSSKNRRGINSHLYKRQGIPCAQCGKTLHRPLKRITESSNQFCDWACYEQWRVGKYFGEPSKVSLICAGCGIAFEKPPSLVADKKSHYCSFDCYRNTVGNRVMQFCLQCGKLTERVPSEIKGERTFCSPQCSGIWHSVNLTGSNHANYSQQVVPCAHCGAELKRQKHRLKDGKKQFCDAVCYAQWITANGTGENAPRWEGGNIRVSCSHCGQPVERPRNAIESNHHHFCDRQCYAAWQSKNFCGEKHPLWKGGWEHYYGPNWHIQRAAARQRDGNKCQVCGIAPKKLGRELDVHHIEPFRTFDYIPGENENYEQANLLSNLITLCPTCHKKAEWRKIPLRLPLF